MNGYLLPRNASQQINYGREIVMEANHAITPDKGDAFKDEMIRRTKHIQKGDLVFFGTPDTFLKKGKITHVGLYIGDGKIIHASHKVRINSLIPGEPDYYENSHKLVAARRFISYQGKGLTPILQSPAYSSEVR
jgi:cell wall-associated NlpC family hydrolase